MDRRFKPVIDFRFGSREHSGNQNRSTSKVGGE